MITNLGTLPGDCYSEAFAINSSGQAVGQSYSCDTGITRSVLWQDGKVFDLNTLIPPTSDLQLDNTFAISDRGEIAGFGLPSGCSLDTQCGHAFLLIPCDDDHSDNEGCEDVAETAIEAKPASVIQSTTAAGQSSGTASEIAERIRGRFGRNPGLTPWSQK